ncbi:MAG: GNAT family N-acetyltransferase [Candidatus Omnitrophota bacterium]|nr:GNAT family N-acetyltransferase [Candidatus Omnitrophota bacterium]
MDNNQLNFIEDVWLAQILGRKTYRLSMDDILAAALSDKESKEYGIFEKFLKQPIFIYAKVLPASIKSIKALEKSGFNLIDTNIVLEKEIFPSAQLVKNWITRFAVVGDEPRLEKIAGSAFKYSRFHRDPLISKDIADSVKVEWVRNFFKGIRGNAMVVALDKEKPIGFLQLINKDDAILIDLIAVDILYQGKGVASAMISFTENNFKGKKLLRVGTQIANIPSLRLYEKAGFRVKESSYIFHYHNE